MNRTGILISAISILLLTSYKPIPKRFSGIKTVVIDAGHGGHDVGCIGSSSREKNIALSVSLKLGEMIEQKFPDVRVIFTRKKDEFVELNERAGIANRAKADLFICIHCNSGSHEAFGAETFVMGLHKSADNLAVARRENSSILLEKDYKTKYDGFDPNSPEANIIFSLFQNAFMNQSIAFASKIQSQFEEYAGRSNRGVKQAGFLVLYRTAMPSVLIETGFLTNKNEEKYLLSEKGQTDIASSIFKAFKEYKIDMEGEFSSGAEEKTQPPKTPVSKDSVVKEEEKAAKKDSIVEIQKQHDNSKEEEKVNKVTAVEPVKDNVVIDQSTDPADKDPVKTVSKPETPVTKNTSDKTTSGPDAFYTVQIGAAPAETKTITEKYKGVDGLKKIKGEDGMIRFTAGNFQNINDAINFQSVLRGKGFKDAFVTAYHNNKRITLNEASQLLKKN